MAIILLPMAAITLLYSAWAQDLIRERVLPALSSTGTEISVDSFRLRFPLVISVEGLSIVSDGIEMVRAESFDGNVEVLPLISGHARLSEAALRNGALNIGGPDSAMYMQITAGDLTLNNADVRLADMAITLPSGRISRGVVDLTINPDTTATDTTVTPPTQMSIALGRLELDDFTYRMRLLPTIDSLGANITRGVLSDGNIDMIKQTIDLKTFSGSRLDVAYITPDSATVAATPIIPESADTAATAPWTVTIDSIAFTDSKALYTTRGVKPLPGLDFTYIYVDSLDLTINDFYNQTAVVRVPLRISGTERCGVRLNASGTLDINETGLQFKDFNVSTDNATELTFKGMLGTGDMTADPSLPLALTAKGFAAASDLKLMFPAFMPYLITLPRDSRLYVQTEVGGTAGALDIDDLSVAVNGVARLKASGRVLNVFDPDRMGGELALEGALIDLNPMKKALLDPATANQFNFPRTTFTGNVDIADGNIAGELRAHTNQGTLSLDADWHSRAEDYKVHLSAERFPIDAFMPLLGVGEISADITVDGHGYDPFSPKMRLNADLDVKRAIYQGYDYKGIAGNVRLADGQAIVDLSSTNPNAMLSLKANGNLAGDTYDWNATLDGRHIDLQALGLSSEKAVIQTQLDATASLTPRQNIIAADVRLQSLSYTDKIGTIELDDVTARLNANDSVTNLSMHNRDLYAFMSSDARLDTLINRFASVSEVIKSEIDTRTIDVGRLQRALPPFVIDVNAGSNNLINDMLADSRSSFGSLHFTAANDSVLTADARVLGIMSGATRIDTLTFGLSQHHENLIFDAAINNRPGTFDEWAHVKLDGFVGSDRIGMQLRQHNIQGKEGYMVGLRAELTDSTAVLHVDPTDPVIAYKDWTVNDDNFVSWSFAHKHLDANLRMHGAGSSLALYTNHVAGHDDEQEELVLELTDIHLSDWVSLNPFAPPMTGDLSANLNISEHDGAINGTGKVTLADFKYDRQRVGTIETDIDVTTDLNGQIRATADLSIDSVRTITLSGALNDSVSGSPLALDFSMIHFPLTAVNPFLPTGIGRLSGTLNGQMDITGTATSPGLDGWLQFDSTAMRVDMTGTTYPFSDVKIPVDSNVVRFNDFAIMGVNEHPLAINGTVDIHSPSDPKINLHLTADNMQIVNTTRAPKKADVYGKGFISLDATARGDMSYMSVNANLRIMPGTNITYVMADAATTLTNQSNDGLVKFVNFNDTAAVVAADSLVTSEMALMLQASLNIQNGSTINVDLSADGKNKVRLQADGTVEMTMAPFSDPRVTGRININKGFVRYTPPLMSEKLFNFNDNSFVAFNGDMMNPTLNIHAVDVLKANVTQSGQNSRLVDFDVMLSVTGTLETMKVAFDLSTDDDITVANELQSMSPDQRANQAMNMLLYNVYTGPGTTANSSLSG
ncbi:MAG: translocation/assembly module TamB domain-containing protein, partial [Bacteroidales bacterium]|nr:translocation/assembly module TamB domain-containing protein [Bacteroidales bacterium]